ncbi:MAG: RnfH family protein [Pseudomonadota bacterium]
MRVEVVYALPDKQHVVTLDVAAGSRVGAVLDTVSTRAPFAALDLAAAAVGVFGEVVDRQHVLRDGDRLEVYRPLKFDPRERRRELAAAGRTMAAKPKDEP